MKNNSNFPEYFSTRTKNALANSYFKINSPDELIACLQKHFYNGSLSIPYFRGIGDKGMHQIVKFAFETGITTPRRIFYERYSEIPDLHKFNKKLSLKEKEIFKINCLCEKKTPILSFKLYLNGTPILSVLTRHYTYKFNLELLNIEGETIADTAHRYLRRFGF